jgi:serine/threonine-protein kinase RsbT
MPAPRGSAGDFTVLHEVRVSISSDSDIVFAREKGRSLGSQLGFSPVDLIGIVTVVSELADNILSHASEGEILLRPIEGGRGLFIEACDRGRGIPNVRRVLQGGYSTSGGLGLGLSGAKRLMDEFEVFSEPKRGTTVKAKKWVKPGDKELIESPTVT